AAECRDLDGKIVLIHTHSRSNSSSKLVLCNEFARPLNQRAEQVQSPGADLYRNKTIGVIPPEQATPIQAKILEHAHLGRVERVHALPHASHPWQQATRRIPVSRWLQFGPF